MGRISAFPVIEAPSCRRAPFTWAMRPKESGWENLEFFEKPAELLRIQIEPNRPFTTGATRGFLGLKIAGESVFQTRRNYEMMGIPMGGPLGREKCRGRLPSPRNHFLFGRDPGAGAGCMLRQCRLTIDDRDRVNFNQRVLMHE